MAKILVGLYDTIAEAECVVVDLIEHDFVRIAMRRMIHDAQGHEADEAYSSEDLYAAEGGFIDELTDMDVPVDEARSYAEGLMARATAVDTSRPPYSTGQVGTTNPAAANVGYQAS